MPFGKGRLCRRICIEPHQEGAQASSNASGHCGSGKQEAVGGASGLAQELIAIETNLEQLTNKKRKILDVYELDGMDRGYAVHEAGGIDRGNKSAPCQKV